MVRGPSPGPAPACQGPGQQLAAHPVELTDVAPPEAAQEGAQGGWRLDRAAQGAPTVPPVRNTSASSMQSPPASADATSVIILSLSVRPPRGIRPGRGAGRTSSGRPRCRARVAGRSSPALATKRRSSKSDLDPVGVVAVAASTGCSLFPGAVFVATNPLSQKHRSTRRLLQGLSPRTSFSGFGLRSTSLSTTAWKSL